MTSQSDTSYLRFRGVTKCYTQSCTIPTTKRRLLKDENPSLSLFFDASYFGASTKGTSCSEHKPSAGCPQQTHSGPLSQEFGTWIFVAIAIEIETIATEGKAVAAHFGWCVCGVCGVAVCLTTVLFALTGIPLWLQICDYLNS